MQRASITTKKCPMYDPICAARVIEQIAERYPRSPRPCDCEHPAAIAEASVRHSQAIAAAEPLLRAVVEAAQREDDTTPYLERYAPAGQAVIDTKAMLERAHGDGLHTSACASHILESIDAAALVEAQCGRYTRGEHKGQLRGWAEIDVVAVGGWKTNGPGERNGGVLLPGRVHAIRITEFSGKCYLSC